MKHELELKAAQLLEKCEEVALASINNEGYPRICILCRIKSEGLNKIWVATGVSSKKTKHFLQNSRASACYSMAGNSVTLVGDVEVLTDSETKHELWTDWFINHFPEGPDDPNYCILKFTAKEATIWIENEFETFKY